MEITLLVLNSPFTVTSSDTFAHISPFPTAPTSSYDSRLLLGQASTNSLAMVLSLLLDISPCCSPFEPISFGSSFAMASLCSLATLAICARKVTCQALREDVGWLGWLGLPMTDSCTPSSTLPHFYYHIHNTSIVCQCTMPIQTIVLECSSKTHVVQQSTLASFFQVIGEWHRVSIRGQKKNIIEKDIQRWKMIHTRPSSKPNLSSLHLQV